MIRNYRKNKGKKGDESKKRKIPATMWLQGLFVL